MAKKILRLLGCATTNAVNRVKARCSSSRDFFGVRSQKEQEKIIREAVVGSNKDQRALVEKYSASRG